MFESPRFSSPLFHYDESVKTAVKRVTLGFALFAFVYVGVSLGISMLIGLLFPEWLEQDWLNWVLSIVPLYGIALPCLLAVILPVPKVPLDNKTIRPSHFLLLIPISVAMMVVGNMIGQGVATAIETVFPFLNNSNPVEEALGDADLVFAFVLTVLVAPVMEELVFRKLLLDRVHPLGEGISVLLSGILFGAFHGNLYQFFYATLLGCVLAFVYLKTGKLIYTVLLHMIVNFACGIVPTVLGQNLYALIPADGNLENVKITADLIKTIWYFLGYVMAEYALAVIGVVLLLIFFRDIKARIVPCLVLRSEQFKTAFLSPGTLLMLGVCLGLFALNLLL